MNEIISMKSNYKLLLACTLITFNVKVYAQYNKIIVDEIPSMLEVLQIDNREASTIVLLKIQRTEKMEGCTINDQAYIRVADTHKKYRLINSINMPISSEAEQVEMLFDYPDQVHCFALEFEKIPEGKVFNIIDNEQDTCAYNIYGISPDTTQLTEFVNLDQLVEDYPITREKGHFIKDNVPLQYVKARGIILTMYVQRVKQYGKYITVNMDLQNFSGKSILFSLDKIKAEGYTMENAESNAKTKTKRKKDFSSDDIYQLPSKQISFKGLGRKRELVEQSIPLVVLSSDEFDKKVAKKQAWNNFWVALGEGMAASTAGYSSSSTAYAGTSHTSLYGQAFGYAGNTYGYANAYGSAYTTTYGMSNTISYSGAAAYAARQQANANVRAFAEDQYEIRQQLNDGYVKNNTIQNHTEYSGFFNIKYKDVEHVKVEFMIDGILFPFYY